MIAKPGALVTLLVGCLHSIYVLKEQEYYGGPDNGHFAKI